MALGAQGVWTGSVWLGVEESDMSPELKEKFYAAESRDAVRSRSLSGKPARLLKTAFTFGDWLPYVLWKVERHSGKPVPFSERQRRHPLVFGWPLLFKLLRNRQLR